MRKLLILALMLCTITSQVFPGRQTDASEQKRKIDDFKKRYFDKRAMSFRNNIIVSLSYYEILLEIDRGSLSESSRVLLDDILAILNSPQDESLRTQYLNDFPKTFSEFLRIFHPPNFKELYHGSYVVLRMFEDILQERPEEGAVILVGLSVDARYDADAPGHLQTILAKFICNSYDFFIGPFNKLAHAPQENIITFICDVENYAAYREFDCIIDKLREQNNLDLLKRFTAAKDERIRIGPHGEKRIKKRCSPDSS